MKIIPVNAGEKDVFIKLKCNDGRDRMYELQSSDKKNTAQLTKADPIKVQVISQQ